MLLSLVYFAIRCLLQTLAPSSRANFEREVELLVLRHQLKVVSRGVRRPPFRRRDRMLLAAASRIVPTVIGVFDPFTPSSRSAASFDGNPERIVIRRSVAPLAWVST